MLYGLNPLQRRRKLLSVKQAKVLASSFANSQNNFHDIWDFLMFWQIFFSPQVKWSAVVSNKHAIYELPHELRNDLGTEKIRKRRENLKAP